MAEQDPAPSVDGTIIAVLGGTGPQGRGLARRFAATGLEVVIGSRSEERATEAAEEIAGETQVAEGGEVRLRGADNAAAAQAADVVIVAVPWDGHGELLRSLADVLAGKVVVDCVNPLSFDKRGAHAAPVEEGSAAEQAAALLPDSRVVGAFHNLSAVLLDDPEVESIESDTLVMGDDREATDLVQALADRIPGMRGLFGGKLRNSHQVEALTANIISLNRRYKVHAGIRVTGL
jgi:NADPH-dependent F420 reductase